MNDATLELYSELGQLPDERSRAVFLGRNPALFAEDVVPQLAEAVRSAVRIDVRRALRLSDAALAVARAQNSEGALALAERAKANSLWFMGDCRAAVDLFRDAADRFAHIGNRSEQARTLSSSIQSLILLGEYEEAFRAGNAARKIFGELGDDWRLARVDLNVANIYHRQNRYRDALAAYEEAYRSLVPFRDAEGIGVALHNLAVCLIALDDYSGALNTYSRLRTVCEQGQMPLLVAQADYNIAFLYYLRGEYTKALNLLGCVRQTYQLNGDSYHVGLCDLDQSEMYLELGLVEEAAEMARSSLQNFEQLGMSFEVTRSLINLAVALNRQGDSEQALKLFGKAKQISAGENSRLLPTLIDLYRALVLLDLGNAAEARDISVASACFFRENAIPSKEILSLLLAVRASLKLGSTSDARRHGAEALAVLEHLDAPNLQCQAYFLLGQVEEAEARNAQAYRCYRQAREQLEALRSSLQREELKIGLMKSRLDVYNRLIRICLDRGTESEECIAEAFSYVEEARSRTLRDLVLQAAQPDGVPEEGSETDARARELRQELNWFYHRIEREQFSQDHEPSRHIESLRAEARTREHRLLHLLREAPVSAKIGAAMQFSSSVELSAIRESLGDQATLLEYFVLDDRIHVAVIRGTELQIVPLAASRVITERLPLLQFQLSKFRLGKDYVQRFSPVMLRATQAHLNSLYRDLVSPVEDLLKTSDLVIVPFGPLHSLPYHALYDGTHYLDERFSICYAPSASFFAHSHRPFESQSGPPLVLGVDDANLPHVRDEIEAVSAALPGSRVLFGPDANHAALREYGRSSRIIHIASHGYFRQDSPMFSAIRLADTYLTLYDLYRMHLPADLLTLSGCVTGLNVVVEGDELLGLTRGLLYAGACSLLLSLWEVDDRSTSEFMREFYMELGRGARKADALRAARIALRNRYPHPYYWAPFKLIGNALG